MFLNKNKKIIISLSIILFLIISMAGCFIIEIQGVEAQILKPDLVNKDLNPSGGGQTWWFAWLGGFNTTAGVGDIMFFVIQGFLVLLGTIFLVLIIYAGYSWMTAAGNEEQLKKAKDTIKRAVIGFLIIACAYSITHFVFTRLPGRQGGPDGPGYGTTDI